MSKQPRISTRTTRSRSTLPPGHLNFDHDLYRALDGGTRAGKQAERPADAHDPLSPTAGPSVLDVRAKRDSLMEKAALLEFAATAPASSPILSAAGFEDGPGGDDVGEYDHDDEEENSHRQRIWEPADCDWSRDGQDDASRFRLYEAGTSSPLPASPLLLPAAEIVSPGGGLGDGAGRGRPSSFLSGLRASAVRGGTLGESADIVGRTPDDAHHRDGGLETVLPPVPRKVQKAQAKVTIAEPEMRDSRSRRVTVRDASDDGSDVYVPTARAAAAAKTMADKGKGKAITAPVQKQRPVETAAAPELRVSAKPVVAKPVAAVVKPVVAAVSETKQAAATAVDAKRAAAPPVKPEASKPDAPKGVKAPAAKPAGASVIKPAADDDIVMSRAEIERLVNQAREAGLKEAHDALGRGVSAPAVAPAPVPAPKKQAASKEEVALRAEKARRDRARREADAEAEQLVRETALRASAARDRIIASQARAQAEAIALAQEKLARVTAEARRLEEESRVMDNLPEELEETPEERLETLARENNFTSAKELVELYRDVAQVLKSPLQAKTPTALKRRTSPKSREEPKRQRHISPERGGVKRKASPGEPVSPRKKKGLGREDALGLDDITESDTIAIPVKCAEILRNGWVKTLRLSMFTPEACRRDLSKALGNEANHLEIGPGGTIGLKGAERHPADSTLREDEWRPAFVNFIRAIEEHYQPRVPDVDEEETYLIPTRKELGSDFQKMFNQLTRWKDYDLQFRVVRLYTERSFTAIQEKRMKMTVGRWVLYQ